MVQDNEPQYDMVAIAKQVEILKQQRNQATDDIAILVGQIESLRHKVADAEAKAKNLQDELNVANAAAKQAGSETQGDDQAATVN